MPDLAEALDEALRDRYPMPGVKRPATHRQGLKARMNQLGKAFAREGDKDHQAGRRAAQAAGIAPDTWVRWLKGSRQPSAASLRKLEGAYTRYVQLPAFRRKVNKDIPPSRVQVTAIINWNGYKNRTQQRTTLLEDMRRVMRRVIRAWAMAGPEAAATAFEEGAATVHNTGFIQFEGDAVMVEFPRES